MAVVRMRWLVVVLVLSAVASAAASHRALVRGKQLRLEKLQARFEALRPLFAPKHAPQPGEWLWEHPEPGQTFTEYTFSMPVRPTPQRRTVDVLPLGNFTPGQQRVVERTVEYIRLYFGLPVRVLPALPDDVIPEEARRLHPVDHNPQVHTRYVLHTLLPPLKSVDTVALLALTTQDLYPEEDWNFVYGQASLGKAVGVWSLARLGNPDGTPEEFRTTLSRTTKTAAHELGHMFSMNHCVAYECVMNGMNNAEEAAAAPPEPCPVCLQKLTWNVGFDPVARAQRLATWARTQELERQARLLERARAILAQQPLPP